MGADGEREWFLDRRYLLAGGVVLSLVWGVECLRKGDLIWPWPPVPLAIWVALLLWRLRRPAPGRRAFD